MRKNCALYHIYIGLVAVWMLATISSCKKEALIPPSAMDENFFILSDNSTDQTDHEMYLFYKATGVASFYTDTIGKQNVASLVDSIERGRYIKLSLNYHPLGAKGITHVPLSAKQPISGVLTLIKDSVFPKLPGTNGINSLLFVESFGTIYNLQNVQMAHGFTSVYGFNTVGIVVKDTELMLNADKSMYAASLAAGFAIHSLRKKEEVMLQRDFFSISRTLGKTVAFTDFYIGLPYFNGTPPAAETIALLYLPYTNYSMFLFGTSLPTEDSDLRSYLTMVFRYTNDEFSAMYSSYPMIIKKYSLIRDLAIRYGYHLPE